MNILTSVLQQYQASVGGWQGAIFPIANGLFGMLLLIELAWVGILIVMKRRSGQDGFVDLLQFILRSGIFYAFLIFSPFWIPAVLNSFMMVGSRAAGGIPLDPSSVVDQGMAIAGNLLSTLGISGMFKSPVNTFVAGFAVLVLVVAFAIIATLLLITLVQSYIVVGGGVLLLGFGGSRWTQTVAERYLSYAVSTGVKLFMLYLVIGIGNNIAQLWAEGLAERSGEDVQVYFEVIVGAIMYLGVVWMVPGMAYDMLHGASMFTMHEGERMAVAGASAGMIGGRMAWGGAAHLAHGGGMAIGALSAGAQGFAQRLLAGPSGGGSGGTSGGGGQGSSGSASSAAVLSQFRNAGQGPQFGRQSPSSTPAATGATQGATTSLSSIQNPQVRARLQNFANLGKKD